MKTITLVTGGFDPIHSGHIAYFEAAKALGDYLYVGLNSDDWLIRKKGKYFMPFEERASVVSALRVVDGIIPFDDSDNTAIDAIRKALVRFPETNIVFANGGDRGKDNIPEMSIESSDRLTFAFGIGGDDKKNSSSWILKNWESQ